MRQIDNSKQQQQCHNWRSSLFYSSLVLVSSCHLSTAFQTASLVSTQQQQHRNTVGPLLLASGIDMERQSNSRSSGQSPPWDAQSRRLGKGSTIGPILADGLSTTQPTQQVPGQPRKKMKPMPVTGYDAQSILDFYDRRPLQVGWRLNSLGFPLLGWYLGLLMDKALGVHEKPEVQRKRGKELRQHLVSSQSVALIKVSYLELCL